MKTVIIDTPVVEENIRCITPMSEAEGWSDEESLPHMLSPYYEEEYDTHAEYDAWPSPMTNSVEDERAPSPQSEADYQTLNSLMNSMPRHHRNTSSCESIAITDEESDSYAHRKVAVKDHAIRSRRMHLKPRFSRRSPSPSDSQNSTQHARHQSPACNSNESNGVCSSCDSSHRLTTRAAPETRFKHPRKDEHESTMSTNLRPPPSPTPSLLASNTRKQMLHRRSVSLNFPDGGRGGLEDAERNRHLTQRTHKLPTGAHSLSSSLVHKRRHRVKCTTHRRSVSFPDQVHPNGNSSISYPPMTVQHHNLTPQSNDPALFSLIGATMGGHHGRVCVAPDVDPHLTHVLRAVSEDHSHTNSGVLEIHRNVSVYVDEDADVRGKAKKRNRKPSRRSRSESRGGLRNTAEKGPCKRNEHTHDSMYTTRRNEEEEITQNKMRDKLANIGMKFNSGRNRTLVDKVETKNSNRFHNEKLKHSISTTAGKKTEEPMESDCFRPTHMESIVEEEGTRLFTTKSISKTSCAIQ